MFINNKQRGGVSTEDVSLQPGEVITGNVVNGIENRQATGKVRLVAVIAAPPSGCLLVAGLTSKGVTQRGEQRMQILDNGSWGWRGCTYVYGKRLTRLSRIDVGCHVGWLSPRDAAALAAEFGLDENWANTGEAA